MKQSPLQQPLRLWIVAGMGIAAAMSLAWGWSGLEARSINARWHGPASAAKAAPPGALCTMEEGSEEIDRILRTDQDMLTMARAMRRLVLKSHGEAQVSASRHLVNLTEDEHYEIASELLLNAKQNPDVLEVLFSDLTYRSRELQLPVLLSLLRNRAHPLHAEAKRILVSYAGADYGANDIAWMRWVQAELTE